MRQWISCYKICYQGHLPIYDPFHERLKCAPTQSRGLSTLVLVKHCIGAKQEKTGFCPARTQAPALTQRRWATEGSPSDRKAKGFVSLWLVSSNNLVFIHHPHFWLRIIVCHPPTKASSSFQSLRHSLKIWNIFRARRSQKHSNLTSCRAWATQCSPVLLQKALSQSESRDGPVRGVGFNWSRDNTGACKCFYT